MFRFATDRRARKPSLTPMIDVVFLLLVFFMLAARFGQDVGLVLNPAASGTSAPRWEGPPRLIALDAASLRLNGIEIARGALPDALRRLMPAADAPILIRPEGDARVQDLMSLIEALQAEGFPTLLVLEP